MLIYIHGFNSSPASIKAQLLGQYLSEHHPEIDYQIPELSHWPEQAMQQLCELIESAATEQVTLIGSSLGGYYSTWLTERFENCRSVLVNPAVRPYELLAEWLGENQNLYTTERYELTPQHLQQLVAIDCPNITRSDRYLLLTQTADETLDYRQAVEKFSDSPQFVQPGGSHGFDRFQDLIPAILAFADGRIELPDATPC